MKLTLFEEEDFKAAEDMLARAVHRAMRSIAKDYLAGKLAPDAPLPGSPAAAVAKVDAAMLKDTQAELKVTQDERDALRDELAQVREANRVAALDKDLLQRNYTALNVKYMDLLDAAKTQQPWPAETEQVRSQPFIQKMTTKPPPEKAPQPEVKPPEPKTTLGLALKKAVEVGALSLKPPQPQAPLPLPDVQPDGKGKKPTIKDVCPVTSTRPPGYVTTTEAAEVLIKDGMRADSAQATISVWVVLRQIHGKIVVDKHLTPTKGLPGRLMVDLKEVKARNELRMDNATVPKGQWKSVPKIASAA